VYHVGSCYTDISGCKVNETLNKIYLLWHESLWVQL